MKYIKLIIATLTLVGLLSISGAAADGLNHQSLIPESIAASSNAFVNDACSGLSQVSDTNSCSATTGQNTFKSIASTVVNILSIVIGILSIIMILVSGIKFMFAGGDSNSVGSAKTTLIYALIGLAIAILAQFLVHEVLDTATNVQTSSYLNSRSAIEHDG